MRVRVQNARAVRHGNRHFASIHRIPLRRNWRRAPRIRPTPLASLLLLVVVVHVLLLEGGHVVVEGLLVVD